jgi:hypothetical protein
VSARRVLLWVRHAAFGRRLHRGPTLLHGAAWLRPRGLPVWRLFCTRLGPVDCWTLVRAKRIVCDTCRELGPAAGRAHAVPG